MVRVNQAKRNKLAFEFQPLQQARDLDPLLEWIGNARFVLLDEASQTNCHYFLS